MGDIVAGNILHFVVEHYRIRIFTTPDPDGDVGNYTHTNRGLLPRSMSLHQTLERVYLSLQVRLDTPQSIGPEPLESPHGKPEPPPFNARASRDLS